MSRSDLVARLSAGACVAVLGLGLAGCGSGDEGPSSGSGESPTATDGESSSAPAGKRITLAAQGDKNEGLVKTLVVTADGKETGGEMAKESLPFSTEHTVSDDTAIEKILVIAKYPDGTTGEISCDISIDGKSVADDASTDQEPAKCLFTGKD